MGLPLYRILSEPQPLGTTESSSATPLLRRYNSGTLLVHSPLLYGLVDYTQYKYRYKYTVLAE